jgi:hypothetical protein
MVYSIFLAHACKREINLMKVKLKKVKRWKENQYNKRPKEPHQQKS